MIHSRSPCFVLFYRQAHVCESRTSNADALQPLTDEDDPFVLAASQGPKGNRKPQKRMGLIWDHLFKHMFAYLDGLDGACCHVSPGLIQSQSYGRWKSQYHYYWKDRLSVNFTLFAGKTELQRDVPLNSKAGSTQRSPFSLLHVLTLTHVQKNHITNQRRGVDQSGFHKLPKRLLCL